MFKPRFPETVTHEFVYRAKLPDGDVLECQTFKNLYKAVLHGLRVYCLYHETEYKYASVELEYGFITRYESWSGCAYEEFCVVRNCGLLGVTTYTEWFCSVTGKYMQFKNRFTHEY